MKTAADSTLLDDFDDTQRLDWVLRHSNAEFDFDESQPTRRCHLVVYLVNSDPLAEGVAGRFLSYGATQRDCIDAFLRGNVKRID